MGRWAAAQHGWTVVWLESWEAGQPGGPRLSLIDKYVCSWTWLSLVGSQVGSRVVHPNFDPGLSMQKDLGAGAS